MCILLDNLHTNMRAEHFKLIQGYANNDVGFDTLAAELQNIIASEPALLNEILALLNEIKTSKPADLPLIQKLQDELERHAFSNPSDNELFLKEDSTIVIAQPGSSADSASTAQPDEDQGETIIKPAVPSYTSENHETVIQSQTTTPDSDETQLKTEEEKTRITAEPQAEPSTLETGQLEPGSIIKNRFILETLIGEGGMGRVFKARDLRKEEAHDRNPFVAIKVLNESFKDHPQAFIALQREAKKAQTLAHPNIVNVYDFDRDGETVYMTMEFLTGDSLDRILRKLSPRTLEKPQAINIIRGICAGLSYAHKRNIIHSDLKPGNVFVTEDGETKIFDFGIARAIKSQDTSGEKTLFDAGSLGGLTPAYASCEMFAGEEPDVRDDIYALACIAYELLGGKHPFNKTPAIKAEQNAMVAGKLSQLSRRQNKTLAMGLSFARDTRTLSVDQFLEGLTIRFSKKQKLILASVLVVIVAVIVSFEPLSKYMRQKQIDAFVTDFQSGDEQIIQLTLKALTKITPALRDEILLAAKDPLISYYEQKALSHIDAEKGLVDFNKANRFLNIANALYPDSAQISLAKKNLQQREQQISSELTTRFQFHLQQGNLLPDEHSDDILDVLDTAEKLDRNHPLITDKRLPIEYAKRAQTAAGQWNFDTAAELLSVATALFPDNQTLQDLQQDITRQQEIHLSKPTDFDVKSVRQQVDALLKEPFVRANWSAVLQNNIQQLTKVLPANDHWLDKTKQQIALYHLRRAENLRKQRKFGEARSTIKRAQKFSKKTPGLDEELIKINRAQEQTVQNQKIQAQKQEVTQLKQQILRLSNNNEVKKAEAQLEKLMALVDKQDSFVKKDAPVAIASAYVRLGKNAILRGDTKTAMQFFTAGLDLVPNHKELQSLREKYSRKASDACEASYAGHGKRASCFDTVDSNKGPVLVVIPATKKTKIFAIGKYEVSVADYNLFCTSSKKCPPRSGNSALPITNVSISDMQNYLQWLSKQAAATYRLPSEQEWTIAAKATAQPPGKDFNCRIRIGNDIVKGNALLKVNSGKKNSWGLVNYVGNAQELVNTSSNKLLAKGGAYQDPLTKCNISFSRKHDGKPDPITGFRVLREM